MSVGFCFAAKKPAKIIDSYWYDESKTILEINNLNDFVEFQRLLWKNVTFEGKEVHLKTDIIVFDTTDSDTWSQNIKPKDFEEKNYFFSKSTSILGSIYYKLPKFQGKFDGNGHYIRGLYGLPLFIATKNALIQNLNISHSYFWFASIVSRSKNSIIRNCNVSANAGSGGLCGVADKTTIKNCLFNGNIKRNKNGAASGITIVARKNTVLDSNSVSGTIIGKALHINGIAGYMSPSSIAMRNKVDSEIIEKSAFFFGMDYEYSFGLGEYGIGFMGGNMFFGATINKHFSLALGFGAGGTIPPPSPFIMNFDGYYQLLENVSYNDIVYSYEYPKFMLLLYFKPRIYFLPNGNGPTPFFDGDIGYVNNHFGYSRDFLFNPSIGVAKFGEWVSIGLKIRTADYDKLVATEPISNLAGRILYDYEYRGYEKKTNVAISLKIGIGL